MQPAPSSAPLVKLAAADLATVAQRAALQGEAAALLAGCASVADALVALAGAGLLIEATRLLAQALPRREAVWWSCMCGRYTAAAEPPAAEVAARDAAEFWVRQPTDENRRAAFAKAQDSGFASPEAWSGVAAFWSGDSMAPVGLPAVPPAPHLAGTAVAGSVALAAVRDRPERQTARLRAFIDSARDIASGGNGRLPPEPA